MHWGPYWSLKSICAIFLLQVTKVGSFYSETLQVIYGVPQGSILGPLLFNVDLIDFFLAEHYKLYFSNYADDTTTTFNSRITFLETIPDLEITSDNLFNWFCYNNFKANVIYSYHLLMQNPLMLKVLKQKVNLVKKFLALQLIVTLLLKNI